MVSYHSNNYLTYHFDGRNQTCRTGCKVSCVVGFRGSGVKISNSFAQERSLCMALYYLDSSVFIGSRCIVLFVQVGSWDISRQFSWLVPCASGSQVHVPIPYLRGICIAVHILGYRWPILFFTYTHTHTLLTHLFVRTFSILLYSPGLCTVTYPQVTSFLFSEIFISTLQVATPSFYQAVCQIKDSRLFHGCSEVGLKMCSSHDIVRLQS